MFSWPGHCSENKEVTHAIGVLNILSSGVWGEISFKSFHKIPFSASSSILSPVAITKSLNAWLPFKVMNKPILVPGYINCPGCPFQVPNYMSIFCPRKSPEIILQPCIIPWNTPPTWDEEHNCESTSYVNGTTSMSLPRLSLSPLIQIAGRFTDMPTLNSFFPKKWELKLRRDFLPHGSLVTNCSSQHSSSSSWKPPLFQAPARGVWGQTCSWGAWSRQMPQRQVQ